MALDTSLVLINATGYGPATVGSSRVPVSVTSNFQYTSIKSPLVGASFITDKATLDLKIMFNPAFGTGVRPGLVGNAVDETITIWNEPSFYQTSSKPALVGSALISTALNPSLVGLQKAGLIGSVLQVVTPTSFTCIVTQKVGNAVQYLYTSVPQPLVKYTSINDQLVGSALISTALNPSLVGLQKAGLVGSILPVVTPTSFTGVLSNKTGSSWWSLANFVLLQFGTGIKSTPIGASGVNDKATLDLKIMLNPTLGTGIKSTPVGISENLYTPSSGLPISYKQTGVVSRPTGATQLAGGYTYSPLTIQGLLATVNPVRFTGIITKSTGTSDWIGSKFIMQALQPRTTLTSYTSIDDQLVGATQLAGGYTYSPLTIQGALATVNPVGFTGIVLTKIGAGPLVSIMYNIAKSCTGIVDQKVGGSFVNDRATLNLPIMLTPTRGSGIIACNVGSTPLLVTAIVNVGQNRSQTGVVRVIVGSSQVAGGFSYTPTNLQLNTLAVTQPNTFSGVGWKTGNSTINNIPFWS